VKIDKWAPAHLKDHLQFAIDLEFWTIPFYMSALYSIVDRTSDAFQFVQSVMNQEMLHVQLAANVANAYGLSPAFSAPVYAGRKVPHLDFNLDRPDPVERFSPYSAEIGPIDTERINAMCLIEYPEWKSNEPPDLHDTVKEYPNIGAFYRAVAYGAGQLAEHLHGGVNQVDLFRAFYRNMPSLKVMDSGQVGFRQVDLLIQAITEQGEGISRAREDIVYSFQDTATDKAPQLSHFEKFVEVRGRLPETYAVKPESEYSREDQELLKILGTNFALLRDALEKLFSGKHPGDFVRLMVTVGADVHNCWTHGVTPRFGKDERS
jgi:Ferritin-like